MPSSALACAFSLTVLLVTCGMANAQSRDAAAAAVPHAAQYDLKSGQNGQTYRLSIAAPFTIDPKVAYPVLYVLDGNFFFGSAAYIEAKLTHDGDVTPAVVVVSAIPPITGMKFAAVAMMTCPRGHLSRQHWRWPRLA